MAPKKPSQGIGEEPFSRRFEVQRKQWIEKNKVLGETNARVNDRVKTESSVPDHEIYGFENEIKSMENFLLDQKFENEFKSLVIVGEYGVGKTALCQQIFNNDEVKSAYAPRIWVSMHNQETRAGEDTKISVLKKILKGLVLEDDMFESIQREVTEYAETKQEAGEIDGETAKEKEFSALLCAINLNLKWKKYLIVLDDVREEDNWNEKLDEEVKEDEEWGKHLSDGFPKGSGGRVIYTTRDESLAKKLVAEEIHRLWPLSDSQTVWNIYASELEKSGSKNDFPPEDKKCIKEELMNKSCGLPLAAILMGKVRPCFIPVGKSGSSHGQTDPSNNSTSEMDKTT